MGHETDGTATSPRYQHIDTSWDIGTDETPAPDGLETVVKSPMRLILSEDGQHSRRENRIRQQYLCRMLQ